MLLTISYEYENIKRIKITTLHITFKKLTFLKLFKVVLVLRQISKFSKKYSKRQGNPVLADQFLFRIVKIALAVLYIVLKFLNETLNCLNITTSLFV